MTSDSQRPFSEVSAVGPGSAGRFEATIDPEWTIAGKPNGGYLLAMLGRAAVATVAQPHVISASAYYLQAPDPGSVLVNARVLRNGRSASQVEAWLDQNGQTCVKALLLIGQLDPASAPYWDRGSPEPIRVRPEDCPRLIPSLPGGMPVAIMDQIDLRLEPETAAFGQGEPRGRGELRGWLGLPGEEDFDPISLLFAVDAFPPATFDIEFAGWVPTLELTVYVRALPAPGPVSVLQRAELIDGRRVDEPCHVWDSSGRLVAQGRQLAGIRLG